jgi:hypothetical protein
MNSTVNEFEFPDGELKEYAANILAEDMLSQVDHQGHNKMLMSSNRRQVPDDKVWPEEVEKDYPMLEFS